MDKYKMTCGCIVDEYSLVFKYGSRLCSKHNIGRNAGRIQTILRRCVDCGKLMNLLPRQHSKIRCDDCKRKKHNEITKFSYQKKCRIRLKSETKEIAVDKKIVAEHNLDLSLYRDGLSKYLT